MMQTPEYRNNEVALTVPVPWLMEHVVYSGDCGDLSTPEKWLYMLSYKAEDTGFGHLVNSILEKGLLPGSRCGVAVIRPDHWLYENYRDGLYLNQGHHRLVAAILLGLDHVEISAWGNSHYDNPELPNLSAHWNDQDPFSIDL